MCTRRLFTFATTLWLAGMGHASQDLGEVSFQREVLPLLARNCFLCHGPDPSTREADLRLDKREDAVRDRDGYSVITPGDALQSELMVRITDDLDPMPPDKHGVPLTEEEIDIFRRWINEGAEYLPHWAISPPTRPAVPRGGSPNEAPIDRFVNEAIAARDMTPNNRAERGVLLRRIHLDLTGLPPTPAELDTFLADESPGAYERVVDRLLESPSYGENWASMWLDLARYADSKGHGSDPLREIWRYRDWVIDAFNENKPFDKFTVEQLAGDLLPEATLDQRLATAFHRNTMVNTEGGTDDEEFRVLAVKDRVKTTAQVWLAMTIGCCECHDHKYDPVTQKDFYSFYAIFNQTADADASDDSPVIEIPTVEQFARQAEIEVRAEAARAELRAASKPGTPARLAWEHELSKVAESWRSASLVSAVAENGTTLDIDSSGEVTASGVSPATDRYTLELELAEGEMKGLRIETLKGTDSLGPGRAGHGNFVLNDLRATLLQPNAEAPTARYVRIENPGPGRILSLAEVEVMSDGVNIATLGEARQSSVAYDAPAARAIDGDTNGDHFAGSVTHSGTEADPWWEVDLGSERPIDSVNLWNRTDGDQQARLSRCHVILLDRDHAPVWHVRVVDAPNPSVTLSTTSDEIELGFALALADFEQDEWGVAKAIDLDPASGSGWAVSPRFGEDHVAAFTFLSPVSVKGESSLRVDLVQSYGAEHTLGRLRLATTALTPMLVSEELRMAAEAAERTEQQEDLLTSAWQAVAPEVRELRARVRAIESEHDSIKGASTPVMVELPAAQRRKTHLLVLGNFLQPAEEVSANTPAYLPPTASDTPTRLDLARWLVSEEHPLTARVTVNRFWSRLFGRGLVSTEENFGIQGSLPTHPELLDWLAVEFLESGWDVKSLIKQMVMTDVYKRSSKVEREGLELDPENDWLTRAARPRLAAEAVRDQALFVSGLLHEELHGPSIYPPQPEGLWKAAFNGTRYNPTKGPERHRRGLYVVLRRTIPHPSMVAFDAPSREFCTSRRTTTNTPLQAFVTLNDPIYVEAAQALGRRIMEEGGATTEERVRFALRLCLCTEPTERKVATLVGLHASELAHFAGQPAEALAASTDPHGPLPDGIEPAEAAAWTMVASALLNMDPFLVRS